MTSDTPRGVSLIIIVFCTTECSYFFSSLATFRVRKREQIKEKKAAKAAEKRKKKVTSRCSNILVISRKFFRYYYIRCYFPVLIP